jgi:hypothetical protein
MSQRFPRSVTWALRRQLLQAPDPLAGEFVHRFRQLWRRSRDGVVGLGVDLQHPGWFAGPKTGLELRAEYERNFAEQLALRPLAQFALHSIDEFDDLERSFEHHKKGRRLALISRVLSRVEMNIRGCARNIGQRDRRQGGKERDRGKFVGRQHDLEDQWVRAARCVRAPARLSSRRRRHGLATHSLLWHPGLAHGVEERPRVLVPLAKAPDREARVEREARFGFGLRLFQSSKIRQRRREQEIR